MKGVIIEGERGFGMSMFAIKQLSKYWKEYNYETIR